MKKSFSSLLFAAFFSLAAHANTGPIRVLFPGRDGSLRGAGDTVGPALDGIATRQSAAYIKESLIEPNKVLAQGFQQLGASPMPPMGLILKPQELEDIQAYLQTLK